MPKVMTVHSESVYKNAMQHTFIDYDKDSGISAISRKTKIPRSTLYGWRRMDRKPLYRLIGPGGSHLKSIPESAKMMSPEKAYVLGVICGDGYASYKHKYVMLEVISSEFIDEFRRCMISVYGSQFSGTIKPTCNGKKRIVVCGMMMTDDIRKYLPKQRSFEWRVPEEIKNADAHIKAAFMKGFFDSEGSVNKHHSMELHSANWSALNEVKCLLMDLGIETSDIKQGTKAFVLYITSKKNIVRFIFLVGTNIQRKYEKMLYLLNSYGVNPRGES